ncbi:anthranilate phosphoribosyltransferase [Brachybacterium muris]|uniref:anthranilate phosphoribosyltransferase n=1 Tax=Brachybacterium muris TaxID=219301 RepID=UPI00195C882B|nr:anthranilate phosphoribosyltransferase [Brachybacterium muris]MBM7500453.1 anthranilate phosphoribosyltransferase [Brachybacterium muris]MCT1431361.1 anthranilate phosphoribosyltransferase [Brachybacterium muris]MCT1998902.1 anthranilate phosphoribosyltransferase [Brachybacterium muris]MCT2178293.1 anthranilate phosphoribosyltransferase [Brachybacterium muris]MCT2296507.1 anthranilate phosphoribosyltransferase [Brachybacterium muris]
MNESTPTWSRITARLVRGDELTHAEASWAMDEVMSGEATPVQLAGFLVALQAKGVTSTELGALADAMTSHARPVEAPSHSIDIVGTGGDLAQTVNISTMASMVIASTGRTVVKHGNRASTSRSGSADVLEALGVRLDLPVPVVEDLVDRIGMTFLFAQVFHPSMRYTAEARKGLGIPTVMNILGPITNPARPRASAVGVADATVAPTVAGVFASRGTSALVFRGQDGLDELTVTAPSDVWEVRGGQVREHVLDAEELLGVGRAGHDALRGGTAEENAQVARDLFAGSREGRMGPVRDAVLLNAAAGVLAYDGIDQAAADGFHERFAASFAEARDALDSGRPAELLDRWARASQAASEGR